MTPFDLVEPGSLAEAIGLLDPGDPTVRPIAGGTALMLMMKAGVFWPTRLVSLRSIEKRFSEIDAAPDGELRIGALTTLSALERAPALKRHAPVVALALRTLSNVRVRNVATVGGHLAHGDPHMDLPPILMALGARMTAAGPSGERSIAAEEFFTGYYETALGHDELLVLVTIPAPGRRRAAYLKCTARSAHDWPALGVAVVLETEANIVREASVVIGAATETPTRLAGAEAVLRGERVDAGEALLRRAGEAGADEASVVADAHGSAAYKKQLVRVFVARALRRALDSGAPAPVGPIVN